MCNCGKTTTQQPSKAVDIKPITKTVSETIQTTDTKKTVIIRTQ